jgi:NAD(P)-dependent dehydrogenase (short-subunit alcohol dehydrogenase family)
LFQHRPEGLIDSRRFEANLRDVLSKGVYMKSLRKVAVVTGASCGWKSMPGLGEAGATVYVTGRTTQEGADIEKLGGTVFATAEQVTGIGGKGIAVACDHRDDVQTDRLFQRVKEENGRLDILVNNAWGGYERMEHDGDLPGSSPLGTTILAGTRCSRLVRAAFPAGVRREHDGGAEEWVNRKFALGRKV